MAPDMAVVTALASPGPAEPAPLDWLLREGPRIQAPGELLLQLCNRLVAAGVPLMLQAAVPRSQATCWILRGLAQVMERPHPDFST